MSFAISSVRPTCTTSSVLAGVHCFNVWVGDSFSIAIKKIKDAVTSPFGQLVVGFGLGLCLHKIVMPPTVTILKFFGMSESSFDQIPFRGLSLASKVILIPYACIIGPIAEEIAFRDEVPKDLKEKLTPFYMNLGLSDSDANTVSRVTSVFFASLIFGSYHFLNAIPFCCNPVLFLPQVVFATIYGLIFGLSKELSGQLILPIGIHIGNNTLASILSIKASL
jgi:membrane protease YdiL (CAAX protease family)